MREEVLLPKVGAGEGLLIHDRFNILNQHE